MNHLDNLLLDTDSYKASHWLQYPPGTDATFFYVESRGGQYERTLFFGLQAILKQNLLAPVTDAHVDEARDFFAAHGEPFNEAGWRHIVREHGGHLPVRIRAVPEGSVVPTHQALVTIESTDPQAFWLPSYLETLLLRVWYPVTVATHQLAREEDPSRVPAAHVRRSGRRAAVQAARLRRARRLEPRVGGPGRRRASGQLPRHRQRRRRADGARLLRRADGRFLDPRGRAQHHHQLGPRARGRRLPQHAAPLREARARGSRSSRTATTSSTRSTSTGARPCARK